MSKLLFSANFQAIYKERSMNPLETLKQLKHFAPIKFMCWGVSRLVNMEEHGLMLKVDAHRLNGWVLITLGYDDTYTVRFFNNQYNEKTDLKMMTGIYFDELVHRIDDVIENIPEYTS